MSLLRKARALAAILRGCRNWPEIAAARLGRGDGGQVVYLRNGLTLGVKQSVQANWGQFFESAIADVYSIANDPADLVVDVGANMGSFTCLAAFTHPQARIFAFEPQADVAIVLRENLARNGLKNVQFTEAAVTADGRTVTLSRHGDDGASNIYQNGEGDNATCPSVTLENMPFSTARRAFIKLDCEGAEGELLEWLIARADRLPLSIRIACEYHPWCPVPLAESSRKLVAAGFRVEEAVHFDESYLFATRAG